MLVTIHCIKELHWWILDFSLASRRKEREVYVCGPCQEPGIFYGAVLNRLVSASSVGLILVPIPQMRAPSCSSLHKAPYQRRKRTWCLGSRSEAVSLTEFFSTPLPGPAVLIYRKAENLNFDSRRVCILDPANLSELLGFPA